MINDKIEEGRRADRLARTVTIPPEIPGQWGIDRLWPFYLSGSRRDQVQRGTNLSLGANRTLVHFRDELPEGATPTLAGQYLAALVDACIAFIDSRAFNRGTVTINGFTPSGRAFYWSIIGEESGEPARLRRRDLPHRFGLRSVEVEDGRDCHNPYLGGPRKGDRGGGGKGDGAKRVEKGTERNVWVVSACPISTSPHKGIWETSSPIPLTMTSSSGHQTLPVLLAGQGSTS